MRASVIVFPGSNCDRDVAVSLRQAIGKAPDMVWHGNSDVPDTDIIVLPGGFSFGDYLRCGSMAAHSPIMRDVIKKALDGVPVLGICNGFQILTESGLLPGVLIRNNSLNFICRDVNLRVERDDTLFTNRYSMRQVIKVPVAHHDGNYFADAETSFRIVKNEIWPIYRQLVDEAYEKAMREQAQQKQQGKRRIHAGDVTLAGLYERIVTEVS